MPYVPAIRTAYDVNSRPLKEIAHEVGVTPRHLAYYFNGERAISLHRRNLIDEALGVSVDWDKFDEYLDGVPEAVAEQEPARATPPPAPQPGPAVSHPTGPGDLPPPAVSPPADTAEEDDILSGWLS